MGRSLLIAMNKCEVEIYKEEKTQRESLYLKEIRRDIRKMKNKIVSQGGPCSDDEAKKTTLIEENAKLNKNKQSSRQKEDLGNNSLKEGKFTRDFAT